MGYYTTLTNCDVWLKEGTDPNVVLQHIKDTMFTDEALQTKARGGRSPQSGDVAEDYWYSWVNNKTCREATKLVTILAEFFDEAKLKAPTKDWPHITLVLEHCNKAGQEDLLMETMAPFIAPNSSVEWRGEDGERYRWEFDGTGMKVQYAVYSWEDA